MSNGNTETRILEMQLDNKDFEDGVRKTIQSLESLEEKLNLKNAGDGFEKISAAANSVQMSHLESGIDAVTNKFTLMGQIGLQVLENISSKIVNTSERILRAATIQPMIDGWSEFEMKTGSVQTILGGIRNQFDDQPTAIHAISEALDELNEYADKTIYNFAQMTENVGKFTNQGISLADSTNAIKGIANWAAAVGANPQQMSRAMYNISQSLGAGSMQLIDWRSIRFANMATPEVKKLFAEVAKKRVPELISQEGKVKFGKKEFDVMEDFEGSLKAGWLTNEVMTEAFSIYAKAYSQEELIAEYGEDLGNQFYEMGVYAEEAATKVRTFTQLIGVLKESLGSGWAQTFDILLGGFEKQTEFLTAIKDTIETIINFQTEDRNTWLENFSNIGGIQVFQDVILQTLDILTDFYWVFNDVAALIFNPFGSSVFNMSDGIFGPRQEGYVELRNTWEGVKSVFDDISRTLDNFRRWLYMPSAKTGRSPIHNLANALSGVAGAAGIAWQVLTGFGKFVFRIFKRFEPLVSSVLDLLGQIGGAIYNVFFNLTGQGSVDKIFDKIEGAIGPVIDVVVGLATAVVDLLHSFLGIDAAANDWTVLGERMAAFWDIFKYDPNLDFVANLKNSLKNALISIFGEDTAKSLIQAWDDNIAPVLESIAGFFQQAFADLNRVLAGLQAAATADYSQSGSVKGGIATFLQAFLEGYYGEDEKGAAEAYTNILGIYAELKKFYEDNVQPTVDFLTDVFTKTLPGLNQIISDFLFGSDTVVITGPGQAFNQHKNGLIDNLLAMFSAENLTEVLNTVRTFFDPLRQGIEDAWNQFANFLFGNETTVMTGPGQSFSYRSGGIFQAIQSYFTGDDWTAIWGSISGFFDDPIKSISEGWNRFYDFLFGQETTVMTGPGQSFSYRSGGLLQPLVDLFGGEAWQQDWEIIKGAFTELSSWITTVGNDAWDTIMDFLFGPETTVMTGPGQSFSYRSGGAVESALTFLNPVFDWLKEKGEYLYDYLTTHNFEDMWRGLNTLLFGYDTTVMTGPGQSFSKHTDGILDPLLTVLQPISDTFEKVKGWALEKLSAIDFGGIWEAIGKFFSGYDEYVYLEGKGYGYTVHHDSLFEKIAGFFERVIEFFNKPEVQSFLGTIERVIGWIGGLGGELWGAVEGLFGGQGLGAFEGVATYVSDGFNKLTGKIFPEGFDIQSILSGLFGGATPDEAMKDAQNKQSGQSSGNSNGGIFGWIVNNLMGGAGAEEFDEFGGKVVADLDQTKETVNTVAEKGTSTMDSIIGSVSSLLPYIAGGAGIAILGKVGDIVTGVTGKRKPTILEQIGMLISAFGDVFKGLGLTIAAAGFAEWVAPGAIDKVFSHITSILNTVFGWIAGIAGVGTLLSGTGNFLLKNFFGKNGANSFDGPVSIIAGIGQGIQGLFDGLQSFFWLAIEVTAADWIYGVDDNGANNFDKALDRVLSFVGKILLALSGSTGLMEIINVLGSKFVDNRAINILGPGSSNADTVSEIMLGLGSLVSQIGDGISAILTGGAIAGVANVDYDKIVEVIKAVLNGLTALVGAVDVGVLVSKLGDVGAWKAFKALAMAGGGLAVALGAIGAVAGLLFRWYKNLFKDALEDISGPLYTFSANFSGAMDAISKLKGSQMADAGEVLKDDLPGIYQAIVDQNVGYNKDIIEERGKTIRDFGNRIKTGVGSLAAAKEAFDKYNTGDGDGFPLAFFKSMTAALEYLNQNGIKELYDEFFRTGFGDEYTAGDERGINSLTGFFTSIGTIGSVLTETNDFWGKQEKLVSAKEGFDAFSDAFSGIQTTFALLVKNMGEEGFSAEKMDSLSNFMVKLSEAVTAYAESYGTTTETFDGTIYRYYKEKSPFSNFGAWLQATGTGIRDLDNALKTNGKYDIDYTQLENALNAIKPLAQMAGEFKDLSASDYRLKDLAWDMSRGDYISFATGLTEFLNQIGSATINPEGVARAQSLLPILGSFVSGVADVMRISQETGDRDGFKTTLGEILGAISEGLGTITTEQIESYATSLQNLKESLIVDGGNTTSIATMIQQVFDNIGDKEVKLKITPIIDDTSFKSAFDLPEGVNVGNEYSRNITLNVNMNDIQKVQIIDSQIESLVAANRETRDKLDGLSSAIGRIRLQINIPPSAFGGRNSGSRSVETYPLVANYQEDFT